MDNSVGGLMFCRNKAIKAEVTVEAVISIVMVTGVIFLLLGVFGNNLSILFTNNGMADIYKKHSTKTDYENWENDPTKSQVAVQEGQMVADQGLSWYHSQAKKTIEELAKLSPLTEAQKLDLAKALTIYAYSDTETSAMYSLSNAKLDNGMTYEKLGQNNGIRILTTNYMTFVNEEKYTYYEESYTLNSNNNKDEATKIKFVTNMIIPSFSKN